MISLVYKLGWFYILSKIYLKFSAILFVFFLVSNLYIRSCLIRLEIPYWLFLLTSGTSPVQPVEVKGDNSQENMSRHDDEEGWTNMYRLPQILSKCIPHSHCNILFHHCYWFVILIFVTICRTLPTVHIYSS